jgi:hypothetical protein
MRNDEAKAAREDGEDSLRDLFAANSASGDG